MEIKRTVIIQRSPNGSKVPIHPFFILKENKTRQENEDKLVER
jgi:hypothetical protein